MRWDQLFADLTAQLEADERVAFESDLVDLTRAEVAVVTLTDRLAAHMGRELRFWLADGTDLRGRPEEVGRDWVLLPGRPRDTLLALRAVTGVGGLSRSAAAAGRLGRLGFDHVLRGIAQNRSAVSVRLLGGAQLTGTIDRVGSDHLDLALHPLDLPRLASQVREVRCLPMAALLGVGVG